MADPVQWFITIALVMLFAWAIIVIMITITRNAQRRKSKKTAAPLSSPVAYVVEPGGEITIATAPDPMAPDRPVDKVIQIGPAWSMSAQTESSSVVRTAVRSSEEVVRIVSEPGQANTPRSMAWSAPNQPGASNMNNSWSGSTVWSASERIPRSGGAIGNWYPSWRKNSRVKPEYLQRCLELYKNPSSNIADYPGFNMAKKTVLEKAKNWTLTYPAELKMPPVTFKPAAESPNFVSCIPNTVTMTPAATERMMTVMLKLEQFLAEVQTILRIDIGMAWYKDQQFYKDVAGYEIGSMDKYKIVLYATNPLQDGGGGFASVHDVEIGNPMIYNFFICFFNFEINGMMHEMTHVLSALLPYCALNAADASTGFGAVHESMANYIPLLTSLGRQAMSDERTAREVSQYQWAFWLDGSNFTRKPYNSWAPFQYVTWKTNDPGIWGDILCKSWET